jgi:DNA-binding XRE family transcriptional regulator
MILVIAGRKYGPVQTIKYLYWKEARMQEHLQTQNEISHSNVTSTHPGLVLVAAALKNNRKRLGLTQIQVAEKLGISQSFLSKLENAKAEPSALQWLQFCEITQIDPRCVMASSRPPAEGMRSEPRPAAMVAAAG